MYNSFRKLSLLVLATGVIQSCASPLEVSQQGNTLERYHKLFAEHRKALCPKGTEEEFNALLKHYRGNGNWVPELSGDVDFVTVEKLLPEMERKLKWIQEQRAHVLRKKKIPDPAKVVGAVETRLAECLLRKREWETLPDGPERKKAGAQSLEALKALRHAFKDMVGRVPYLTNYAYPVDHLKNRKIYDEFKSRSEATSQQIANYAFFYRRLLEDGAYNPDHTGSDSWLRTTLDTVELELERPSHVIEEDLRYDLEFVLARLRRELERGQAGLATRLGEWEERTAKAIQFYRDLVDPSNREKARALIQDKNQATLQLKEWVFARQAKSWLWWSKQDENMKALYALDTILYNEVGDVDADEALERMDVAQVVVNRTHVPHYRTLDETQDIYKILRHELSEKQIQQETWLNVLYRLGEFSFTYYYMSGSVKAICPDLSPTGKRLQRENLDIGISLLREPRKDFPALRYFSRASMPGRINMASVWEDYAKYPEREGLVQANQDSLRQALKQGELTYLYQFKDPSGVAHHVYALKNKIYVARLFEGTWLFFSWRNPHYFTYFTQKS